jgi:hypothetical protein
VGLHVASALKNIHISSSPRCVKLRLGRAADEGTSVDVIWGVSGWVK